MKVEVRAPYYLLGGGGGPFKVCSQLTRKLKGEEAGRGKEWWGGGGEMEEWIGKSRKYEGKDM